MRAHRSTDYLTKITAVEAAETPDCTFWLQFLEEAAQRDAAFIKFLKQWCGYSLTGDTREHAPLFVYGGGGNGSLGLACPRSRAASAIVQRLSQRVRGIRVKQHLNLGCDIVRQVHE